MSLTSAEQYMLELINRARLDPLAEAARYDIDLNQNLSAGQLHSGARGVLAPEAALERTAIGHSKWMLAQDVFSHTGVNNSSPAQRAAAAGYQGWGAGENISWRGTTGTLNLQASIAQQHVDLFLSASHRLNILYDSYREIGIAQEAGQFSSGGTTYNASMVTQNFSTQGAVYYVTGVVYDDTDKDRFYSLGEGRAGAQFATQGDTATSARAGGYALAAIEGGAVSVTGSVGGKDFAVSIMVDDMNAKLDVVNGKAFYASASLTLLRGIQNAELLGSGDLDATGTGAANQLSGNAGRNLLSGQGGRDVLAGRGGDDTLQGGSGTDRLAGGTGHDLIDGNAGKDRLSGDGGNDVLRGGTGADQLFGGSGNDMLHGDAGNDRLTGGSGDDGFVFTSGTGRDVVTDFSPGDVLHLDQRLWGEAAISAAEVVADHASLIGGQVVIDLGQGNAVTLLGVTSLAGLAEQILLF